MKARLLCHLLGLLVLGLPAVAQEVQDSPGNQGAPTAAPAPSEESSVLQETLNEVVSREQVQKRVGELEGTDDLDEAGKSLLRTYREVLQNLESEKSFAARGEVFLQAVQAAPEETKRIRARLAERSAPETGEVPRPADATVDSLLSQRVQREAELSQHRSRLAEVNGRITSEKARPELARQRMTVLRSTLDEVVASLLTPAPKPESPEAVRAARMLLTARREALGAELQMLEQEVLSNGVRIELLTAKRDEVAADIAHGDAELARLNAWVSDLRQIEAQRAREEAERLRKQAEGKHPLLEEAARELAEVTSRIEGVGPKIDRAIQRRLELEKERTRIETEYKSTLSTLDHGLSESLGAILLEQRRSLRSEADFRRSLNEHVGRIAQTRLLQFNIQRELDEPVEITADQQEGPSGEELASLEGSEREELDVLIEAKRESLGKLYGANEEYLKTLFTLEAVERDLVQQTAKLRGLLDENLLWIPNAEPLSEDLLVGLRSDVAWLVSPESWSATVRVLWRDFRSFYYGYFVVLLLAAGLLASALPLVRRLRVIGESVGNVRKDSIYLTLHAAFVHLLRVLPIPGVLAFLGWRLKEASLGDEFTEAVATGLVVAAIVDGVLRLLRTIQRPNGLGPRHFRWSQRTGQIVRRNLFWFTSFAVPLSFVITLTQEYPETVYRDRIGRVAFIALLLVTAVLAWFLLHPRRGIMPRTSAAMQASWWRRTRIAWLPLGMLVPAALAGMAAAGYYYAALQLEYRLNRTILSFLAAILVYSFLYRWLLISQRRLAMKVALDKRAALIKSREEEGGDAATEEGIEIPEEIDVAEVKEQTEDLLKVAVGVVLAVAVWLAWVGVLPALRVFDNVTLWHHTVVTDGQMETQPITLANLGLAMLAIAVMVTAARNMPGFLEIAFLQRLPIDPGARYAARTLVLYTIVITGILVAFNAIGVGWSSVQWLLAALTVGLGFGLQEIFANFVSGLIILLERPVRVGDTVTVGEISGVVSRIRMRATTITDWSRRELIVPNKNFITGELINWSLSDPILRLDFPVGVAYGSDTSLAHSTILGVCRRHPLVLEQPESNVFFLGFGDNSLNFDVRVFVAETSNVGRSRIVHDLHMAIDKACRENDITIAFPQRDLHLKSVEATLKVEHVGPRFARGHDGGFGDSGGHGDLGRREAQS